MHPAHLWTPSQIHYITESIRCCGAGTAADTEFITALISSNMELHALSAGIFNDLGSGSNVDACVITASHTEMLRNYVRPNQREQKERRYGFRKGTTAWTAERVRSLVVSEDVVEVKPEGEAMDTS